MLNDFIFKTLILIVIPLLLSSQQLLLAIDESEVPPSVPLGMPSCPWPKDNPYTKKKAELGKLLFFDKRLSSDGTVSCATCHVPGLGYSEDTPIAIGIHGQKGSRNSPTVINTAYQTHCFWDGRASSLEEQVKGPLTNPKEMTSETNVENAYKECRQCVHKVEGYRTMFKEVFGNDECSIEEISKAIATFERTVVSGNSLFDQYMAGNKKAMSIEQIDGLKVFKKVGCANCHAGPNFTDGRFLNIGVGMDSPTPDLGRYEITKNDSEKGAFKIPTLRDVSKTAPYMHDGSLKTLEDVVDYYDRGGTPNRYLSPLMKPLHLTIAEKKALVSFLRALDGEGWQVVPPKEFP